MEGYQQGGGGGRMGEKVQGMRSINGRYKIDRGRLRKYKKFRSQRTYMYDPWAWSEEGDAGGREGAEQRGIKGRKKMGQL